MYKPNSLYNRRFEQRWRLKELLGKSHRPLIGKAMWQRKKDFLEELTKTEAEATGREIGVGPGDLWRAARGNLLLAMPPRIVVQLELSFGE